VGGLGREHGGALGGGGRVDHQMRADLTVLPGDRGATGHAGSEQGACFDSGGFRGM